MINVTLDWPNSKLFANRNHGQPWQTLSKIRKEARQYAWLITKNLDLHYENIPMQDRYLCVTLTVFPPDKRRRDIDGIVSACKNYQDGIFDALGLYDHMIYSFTVKKYHEVEKGKLVYTIMEMGKLEED